MSYKIKYYDEIPFTYNKRFKGKNQQIIKEFIQSGKPCALVEDPGRNQKYVTSSLCHCITRLKLENSVRATMRKGKVYLVRVYKGDGIHDED